VHVHSATARLKRNRTEPGNVGLGCQRKCIAAGNHAMLVIKLSRAPLVQLIMPAVDRWYSQKKILSKLGLLTSVFESKLNSATLVQLITIATLSCHLKKNTKPGLLIFAV